MKIIKGNKQYNAITGNDVILTKGSKSLQTVDDAIDSQQKEIDKLKSNMKYIYSYGGVGGNGSGSGSGSSTTEKEASITVSLGNHKLQNEGEPILLSKENYYNETENTYLFEANVRNSGGNTYYITITLNDTTTQPIPLSTSLNMCTYTTPYVLKTNGSITVTFLDSDGGKIDQITQSYIVKTHTFTTAFKYYTTDGKESSFSSENEYRIGNTTQINPFVDISYKISVASATNVKIEYSIGDTDETSSEETTGQGVKEYGTTTDTTSKHFKIYLSNLLRGGEKFLKESNTGNYTVTVTLSYTSNGSEVSDTNTFNFTLIPNYLYINVRNPQGFLYNTLEELEKAIKEGEDGIPKHCITEGSYASFYVKVYEGSLKSQKTQYSITCSTYDESSESENEFNDEYSYRNTISVEEQVESSTPFSVPFDTIGIKKIVFKSDKSKTGEDPNKYITTKYIYVKSSDSSLSWIPDDVESQSYYFMANCGNDTYSDNFPKLSSGNQPLSLTISDKSSVTLTNESWEKIPSGCDTTVLSLGLQYSETNEDSAEILEIFEDANSRNSYLTLYSDHIFDTEGEICIPAESEYNSSVISQYHLVQVVRSKIEGETGEVYGTYLYIDGILESTKTSVDSSNLYVAKILLNKVNVSYNLINLQYIKKDNYTIDELIYQYSLKYKEKMKQEEISVSEKAILNGLKNYSIKFDGTNVVMSDATFLETIAPNMPIPTMMFSYQDAKTDEEKEAFKTALFQGYANGDKSFNTRYIDLYWCDGLKDNQATTFHKIEIPSIHGIKEDSLTGKWYIALQGTSTMRNRIKNFSLGIETDANDNKEKILVSPNYSKTDTSTFLPETEWTIKADIADSAHANNTSVGKFVNATCTKFATGQNYSNSNTSKYIKNTLEGFPVLMFFQIGSEVYYFGVYNFNMGRSSYYNLGYHTADDMEDMIKYISSSTTGDGFCFSRSVGAVINNLAIGEIQDNFAEFDFHQIDTSVLFDDGTSNNTKLFGKDSKITYGSDIANAKTTLTNFVKSVAKAGTYCFGNIGKNAVSSYDETTGGCIGRYNVVNQVPDVEYQMKYVGDTKTWVTLEDVLDKGEEPFGYNTEKYGTLNDPDSLYQCISTTLSGEDAEPNIPYLNYTSGSEYYTVCMAFGLIDSIMKNMNIKSWTGKTCYIAFYDMDCAFGEDNSGAETVSYLAATDYWHSDKNAAGVYQPATIDWDYWDDNVGKGFDYKSSYLFAIIKYAPAILGTKFTMSTRYPQNFWATLRNGELSSSDNFIKKYFKSGIGSIPTYLASLNYKVKYLYTGSIIDETTGEATESRNLANCSAFHGSRIEKVRVWLKKRLHFMDVMFNVQKMNIPIGNGVMMPTLSDELYVKLKSNEDIAILRDAFSTDTDKAILKPSSGDIVNIYAPVNTPLIIENGGTKNIYLLSAGTNERNAISLNFQQGVSASFAGSKDFTNVSSVEQLLTSAYQIVSNKLKHITYGGASIPERNHNFIITSTSVETIDMNIPTMQGKLIITSDDGLYGKAVNSLNISNSGYYGSWDGLTSLQSLNISSVWCPTQDIVVRNCKLLKGDNCTISGESSEKLTQLKSLSMNDISGNFSLSNTAIGSISLSVNDGEDATFEIKGDQELTSLSLTGFRTISISECPNLKSLIITDGENNKCEKIIISIPTSDSSDNDSNQTLTSFNSGTTGVFDFTNYEKLEILGLSGCISAEVIKIPNHKVKVTTFQNNTNLEFVDTVGEKSVIALTADSTFYGCPKYGMYQSWSSNGGSLNGKDITTTAGTVYDNLVKTKMCVDDDCITLAHTFNKVYNETTIYTSSKPYTNEWGQKVVNSAIGNKTAKWFINNVVAGEKMDDAYLDDSNIIHDSTTSSGQIFGNNCCGNIESLNSCFRLQSGIVYNIDTKIASTNIPDLSEYTSLTDVSNMYYNTGIKFINADLLSLPDELNTNDGPELLWNNFANTSSAMNVSTDVLKHISYRITDLSNMIFTVYKDEDGNISDDVSLKKLLGIKKDTGSEYSTGYIPLERLTRISTFSFNTNNYVDYSNMFNTYCPNVTEISHFLNGDLSSVGICNGVGDGLLKNCTKLVSIVDSFNHTGDMSFYDNNKDKVINLYTFFNWENEDVQKNVYNLFTSSTSTEPGFCIKKTISFADFQSLLTLLSKFNNTSMTKLSNIFSYCTITGYDGEFEITLGDEMTNIKNINALFYKCNGVNASGVDVPLNIRRSFFEKLPNITSMSNTFYEVNFNQMPSYDFFCKMKETTDENIYVFDGDGYKKAKLISHDYGSDIMDMYNCFNGAKFWNCKCWFDPYNDESEFDEYAQPIDKIVYSGNSNVYTTYYTKSGSTYIENTITEPVSITDTKYNFTNYVDSVSMAVNNTISFNNHNINSDRTYYSNNADDVIITNSYNLYPTYCCLPPDILYGCYNACVLTGTFANTNIIGVLPQHLLNKCYNSNIKDILLNTNILPNVMYHYDSLTASEQDYLDMIADIPVDNNIIMNKSKEDDPDYTLDESKNAVVLFRNSDGVLRRRLPRTGAENTLEGMGNADYSRSQFVYVPQGFLTNENLKSAFTFRYNLPKNVDLVTSELTKYNKTWATGSYGKEYSPDDKPYLWPYYTQYFFLVSDSVNWSRIKDMSTPFIQNSGDVDFSSNESRVLSTNSTSVSNVWRVNSTGTPSVISRDDWNNNTGGIFNVFLNLCGSRDSRTGEISDCGCMISKSFNNYPKLDGFVSGNLGAFLNGRVFDDSLDAGQLTTATNTNGSKIVNFEGFGKNILLPIINNFLLDEDADGKPVLSYNKDTSLFYEYMFLNSSENNYKTRYFKSDASYVINNSSNSNYISHPDKYKVS